MVLHTWAKQGTSLGSPIWGEGEQGGQQSACLRHPSIPGATGSARGDSRRATLPRLGTGRARQGPCAALPGHSVRARRLPLPEGLGEGTAVAWHCALSNAVTARRSLYPCLDVQPRRPRGSSATPPWLDPSIQPGTLQRDACDTGHWCHWDRAGSSSGAPVLPWPSSNTPPVPVPPVPVPPVPVPPVPVSPCAHQCCQLPQAMISPLCPV